MREMKKAIPDQAHMRCSSSAYLEIDRDFLAIRRWIIDLLPRPQSHTMLLPTRCVEESVPEISFGKECEKGKIESEKQKRKRVASCTLRKT